MKKIYSLLVLFIVFILATHSFPKETHTEKTTAIQKSDDVVVISNPKTPELKMRIVFTEELSIGEAEGDENYMFGQNIGFNTDEDGNFYVSDSDNQRILKYDPEGKYLLTIGREGQGPGEFQNLSLVRFDKDDNLYLTDAQNNRISFFDKDGKYLRQIRMTERHLNPFINSKGSIIANKFSVSQEGNVQKQISLYGLFDDKFNLVMELYTNETEMSMPAGLDESSIVQFLARALSQQVFRPQVIYTMANNDFIYFHTS